MVAVKGDVMVERPSRSWICRNCERVNTEYFEREVPFSSASFFSLGVRLEVESPNSPMACTSSIGERKGD